jgi:hypothetical protein
MLVRSAHEVRTGWGDVIRAVTDPDQLEHIEITRTRGKNIDTPAVMVPAGWYASVAPEMRPNPEQVQTLGSKETRVQLRTVLNAAAHGTHTQITIYGDVEAVLVPHAWYQQVRNDDGATTPPQPPED